MNFADPVVEMSSNCYLISEQKYKFRLDEERKEGCVFGSLFMKSTELTLHGQNKSNLPENTVSEDTDDAIV